VVFQEGGLYHMYYLARKMAEDRKRWISSHSYARSQDGIHWEKPNLGLVEMDGSRENNIVLQGRLVPFVDNRPGVPQNLRIKATSSIYRDRPEWKNEHPLDGKNRGDLLFAGSRDKVVKVYSLKDGRVVHELRGHREMPYGYLYRVSPDNRLLATGSQGQVNLWDLSAGELRLELPDGPGATVVFAFSPDGRFLAGANEDTNVRVWSLDDGQLVAVLDDLPLLTPSLEFTTEGRRLIGANVDGRIYMWNTTTWKRVRQFKESQPEAAWSRALCHLMASCRRPVEWM